MIDFVRILGEELSLTPAQVANSLRLHEEGATVSFLAKYRKEKTGELTEPQLRTLFERHAVLRDLELRKQVVMKSIQDAGALTEELRQGIDQCVSRTQLDDLVLPYRARKKTRGSQARERGLEPLARAIQSNNSPEAAEADLESLATPYVFPDRGITSPQDALAGASDILADEVSAKAGLRAYLRDYIAAEGTFMSVIKDKYPPGTTKFEMYRDYRIAVKSIQAHNVLALRRGERAGILTVTIEVNEEHVQAHLEANEIFAGSESVRTFYRSMLKDAWNRLMRDQLVADVRAAKKEAADLESIRTFEANLRDVLLSPPAGRKVAMGVNPGAKSGCKIAVVDAAGTLLEHQTIAPLDGEKKEQALAAVKDMIGKHGVQLIAVAHGSGGREIDRFFADAAGDVEQKPLRVTVNETPSALYSTSKIAKEEFPNMESSIRLAISLARRLQDPLTELVKIEPRSIGVGQYQNDVDQKMLDARLEETVQSCVNLVGVEVNTAHRELLRRVSGLNGTLAASIIAHRSQNGPLKTIEELRTVTDMTPRAFEQAAGFLRVRDGAHPLDLTAIHPEQYPLAHRIAEDVGMRVEELARRHDLLRKLDLTAYLTEDIGEPTLKDILAELAHPGRDPRKEFRYATFKEGVREIKDLTAGMEMEGVITNVTNFGAFVDIGVHHDGLVHVSQLADRYVSDPKAVAKVGQVVKVKVLEVNEAQKRISLTMKGLGPRQPHRPKKKGAPRREQQRSPQQQPPRDERSYTIEDLKSKFNQR